MHSLSLHCVLAVANSHLLFAQTVLVHSLTQPPLSCLHEVQNGCPQSESPLHSIVIVVVGSNEIWLVGLLQDAMHVKRSVLFGQVDNVVQVKCLSQQYPVIEEVE